MSQEPPTAKFLTALDDHIEARISKATLQFERLHARERGLAEETANENCTATKAALEAAITDLLRDSRRPGI